MFFAIAALVVSIGSALYSADEAGDAAKANSAEARRIAKANAEIDLYNASVSRAAKSSVQREYQSAIGELIDDTGALLATQKTGYAASGVNTNTGTPLTMTDITKRKSVADVDTLLWNQKQKVSELESEAVGFERAAKLGILKGDSTASQIMANSKAQIASIYASGLSSAASIAASTWG